MGYVEVEELINPWLLRKLEERKLLEEASPQLRLIVEVQPDYMESVKAELRRMRVRIIDQTFNFIKVEAPPALIPEIAKIEGVFMVHYDMPVTIVSQVYDPLVGRVRPSEVEFEYPGPDLFLPLSPLRTFFGLLRGRYVPTGTSRKQIIDVRTPLTGRGVKVAVLDTGIELVHPQIRLKGRGYSTCLVEADPIDRCGHGQHCVTIISGDMVAAIFGLCQGMAPDVRPLGIKVLSGFGTGTMFDVMKGMELADKLGADVVSMSLGSSECQGGCGICPQCRVIAHLSEKGRIFVIAAGNSGPDVWTISCPGCEPSGITVGSWSITDGSVAWFSSRGPSTKENKGMTITEANMKPDVVAPGGGRSHKEKSPDEYIYTGIFGWLDGMYSGIKHGFEGLHGTSMATPHISGLIALLVEAGKVKMAEHFKAVVRDRGEEKDIHRGWGLPKLSWWVG